jgi:hypothetical protein
MFKSTLTTLGRILIILVVAGLIVAGLSLALSSSSASSPTGAPSGEFTGTRPAGMEHHEGGEGGGGAFGLLELVKNIGVIGLIITVFYQLLKWIDRRKRPVLQF